MYYYLSKRMRQLMPYYSAAAIWLLYALMILLRQSGVFCEAVMSICIFFVLTVAAKPPAAYYGVSVSWLLYALFAVLKMENTILIPAAASVTVFTLIEMSVPYELETPVNLADSSQHVDSESEEILNAGQAALGRIERVGSAIENPAVRDSVSRLAQTGRKIFDEIRLHPEKALKIRQFTSYYLPTVQKMVVEYQHLEASGATGDNTKHTLRIIEETLDPAVRDVFQKRLDSLFSDEAMDISSDISVLKNIMAGEGITDLKL